MKKLLIVMLLAFLSIYNIKKDEYIVIPKESIRMRVIASSNSPEDIKNKMIIKKGLTKELNNIVKDTKSYAEADYNLNSSYDLINKTIKKQMRDNNINQEYSISYGYNYFPEKKKAGIIYKAGNYKSYVVTLGKGKGDNFWCVLFPPLCLIDENNNNHYTFLINDVVNKYK